MLCRAVILFLRGAWRRLRASGVTMDCRSFGAHAMCFVAHGVNSACVDPPVIEIEQCTNRNGIVDRFISVSMLMECSDIRRTDGYRILIHLPNKLQQGLFGFG